MDTTDTVRSDFATRLYQKLARTHAGDSLFLSPFSIRVALAMCAVGARGETRRVLAGLIGAPDSVDEQNRRYAELLKAVHGDGERPFQLVTANALWGQQGCRFRPDYKKAVAEFYDGAFNEVNFTALPDKAVKTINAWVCARTGERIKDLVQRDLISADTRLILTNAIYFKAQWSKQFETFATRDEDWYGPGGARKVPMMHQRGLPVLRGRRVPGPRPALQGWVALHARRPAPEAGRPDFAGDGTGGRGRLPAGHEPPDSRSHGHRLAPPLHGG